MATSSAAPPPSAGLVIKVEPMPVTLRMSFYVTYVLLITTGTVTAIEALRTKVPNVRHVMNLETCISVVAAYFYGEFMRKLDSKAASLSRPSAGDDGATVSSALTVEDYREINVTRYADWCITTPIMLLVLALVLTHNNAIAPKGSATVATSLAVGTYGAIVALNFAMLLFGYLGEIGKIPRTAGTVLGFSAFAGMFALLWLTMVRGSRSRANHVVFAMFLCIWSLYGVAYAFDEKTKNLFFNVLDCVAKCFVGLGLWAYFSGIFS